MIDLNIDATRPWEAFGLESERAKELSEAAKEIMYLKLVDDLDTKKGTRLYIEALQECLKEGKTEAEQGYIMLIAGMMTIEVEKAITLLTKPKHTFIISRPGMA